MENQFTAVSAEGAEEGGKSRGMSEYGMRNWGCGTTRFGRGVEGNPQHSHQTARQL